MIRKALDDPQVAVTRTVKSRYQITLTPSALLRLICEAMAARGVTIPEDLEIRYRDEDGFEGILDDEVWLDWDVETTE